MSDSQPPMQDWNAFAEQWNEQFLEALEDNMEAQAQFVESWSETVGEASDDTETSDGVEGYARAYETWMTASPADGRAGERPARGRGRRYRGVPRHLAQHANEAFKEVMSTTAFAKMTGETVGDVLELQEQADEAAQRRSTRWALRPKAMSSKSVTASSNSSAASTPSSRNSTACSSERRRQAMNNPATALNVQRQAWEATADLAEKTKVVPDSAPETVENIDVGQTPSEVVYEENKLELHYEPMTEEQHGVPILIVYALINKPYILDLQPDRSVVQTLLEAGFDVYLIDWGEPLSWIARCPSTTTSTATSTTASTSSASAPGGIRSTSSATAWAARSRPCTPRCTPRKSRTFCADGRRPLFRRRRRRPLEPGVARTTTTPNGSPIPSATFPRSSSISGSH